VNILGGKLFNFLTTNSVVGEKMEKKTKILAIAALLMITVVSGAFFLIPITSAEEMSQIPQSCIDENLEVPLRDRIVSYWIWRRDKLLMKFIRSGSFESLEGSISAVTRNMLVIECNGKTINVILPGIWVYNGEVVNTLDLIDGEPFKVGDITKLETLMLKLEKEDHTITSYLALSITVDADISTALLPFNVEPIKQ
jgi:hypothetical protein